MSKFLANLKKQCIQQPIMMLMGIMLCLNAIVMMNVSASLEKAQAAMAVFDGAGLAQAIKDMGVSNEQLQTMKMAWETSQEVLARTEDVLQATGYGQSISPGIVAQFGGASEAGGPIADILNEAEANQFPFDKMMKLTNVGLTIMQKGGLENITFADGYSLYDTMFGDYVSSMSKRDVAREYSEATTRGALESNWATIEELPNIANDIMNLANTAQTLAGSNGNLRAQQAIDTLTQLQTNRLLMRVLQQNAVNDNQRIAREQEAAAENGRWSNPDADSKQIEVEGTPWLKDDGSANPGQTNGGGWQNPDEQQTPNNDWVNPDEVQQALGG